RRRRRSRERHLRPLLPLRDRARGARRSRRDLDDFGSETLVRPQPWVEVSAVRAAPTDVPLHRSERVQLLEVGLTGAISVSSPWSRPIRSHGRRTDLATSGVVLALLQVTVPRNLERVVRIASPYDLLLPLQHTAHD